jgi:hypothetical protein
MGRVHTHAPGLKNLDDGLAAQGGGVRRWEWRETEAMASCVDARENQRWTDGP